MTAPLSQDLSPDCPRGWGSSSGCRLIASQPKVFSRAYVESHCHSRQIIHAVYTQVRSFREVLAQSFVPRCRGLCGSQK